MRVNLCSFTLKILRRRNYIALKCNRLVDDADAKKPYQRIDSLQWTEGEKNQANA